MMNPLLQELEASDLDLTISSLYAGGFAHADDIRMLATSDESLEAQVERFGEAVLCCKLSAAEC